MSDAGRAVDQIVAFGMVLVAEPQRDETAVVALFVFEEREARFDGGGNAIVRIRVLGIVFDCLTAVAFFQMRCQTASARITWAVRSLALRSNGNVFQPRQNVGQPPSLFCRSSSHSTPWRAASRRRCCLSSGQTSRQWASASSAPAVLSASGTPPARSVHDQPPGLAPVTGCGSKCWQPSNQSRHFSSNCLVAFRFVSSSSCGWRHGNAIERSVTINVSAVESSARTVSRQRGIDRTRSSAMAADR